MLCMGGGRYVLLQDLVDGYYFFLSFRSELASTMAESVAIVEAGDTLDHALEIIGDASEEYVKSEPEVEECQ